MEVRIAQLLCVVNWGAWPPIYVGGKGGAHLRFALEHVGNHPHTVGCNHRRRAVARGAGRGLAEPQVWPDTANHLSATAFAWWALVGS